ncbi:MAG TPA: flagellar biosynthesis protein FlgJ [Firmicutes bacterium]|nr:flagellar biosynthesis protein FlgJ [Bacillota bacterium]
MTKMLPLGLTTQFRVLPPLSGTPRALGPERGFAGALTEAQAKLDEDPQAVRKAARDLESVFLNLLWQQMWRTVGQGSGSFFPQGLAGEIYRDFLTQAYADRMAEAGGIGLADLVASNLRRP